MYEYDDDFYGYINQGSIDSARVVLPALLAVLPHPVQSVLDVGCGAGAWLTVWKSLGAETLGLDGNYVRPEQLLISPGEFSAVDLSGAFLWTVVLTWRRAWKLQSICPRPARPDLWTVSVVTLIWCYFPLPRPGRAAKIISMSSPMNSGEICSGSRVMRCMIRSGPPCATTRR